MPGCPPGTRSLLLPFKVWLLTDLGMERVELWLRTVLGLLGVVGEVGESCAVDVADAGEEASLDDGDEEERAA